MKKTLFTLIKYTILIPLFVMTGPFLRRAKMVKAPKISRSIKSYRQNLYNIPNDFQSEGSEKIVKFARRIAKIFPKNLSLQTKPYHESTRSDDLYTMW